MQVDNSSLYMKTVQCYRGIIGFNKIHPNAQRYAAIYSRSIQRTNPIYVLYFCLDSGPLSA